MLKHIRYIPSKNALRVLIKGNILAPNESPQEMFERVIRTLFSVESKFHVPEKETDEVKEEFARYMADKMFTPGTPTLTNAGRQGYEQSALSSCAIIPVDLRNKVASRSLIKAYYRQNMGSGFDLTPYKNPIDLLLWLNSLAAHETKSGKYDRYIGNMANLHISHPHVQRFIRLKQTQTLSHFNCSVVVDEAFMEAVVNCQNYIQMNKKSISAQKLLWEISESAWCVGDPSIINLERMNRDNPISDITPYVSAPPCAEMGLSLGETCQFIYINISKFCKPNGINYELLKRVVQVVTRGLDNAVEYGISRYPDKSSSDIARLKRKIGIAVSGIADTLIYYGIPYSSKNAHTFIRDIVSFINYHSKLSSYELALKRGPCEAMKHVKRNKYFNGYLKKRYSFSTNTVSSKDWEHLDAIIFQSGMLRNIHTLIQPPAARVSLLMDTSFGIEPFFNIPQDIFSMPQRIKEFVNKQKKVDVQKVLQQAAQWGTFQKTSLSKHAKDCLKTATELLPSDHLNMVAALVGHNSVIDETASKTVNLSRNASVQDIYSIFLSAHTLGLKNISVYRDGSYENQPYELSR